MADGMCGSDLPGCPLKKSGKVKAWRGRRREAYKSWKFELIVDLREKNVA